MVIEGMRGLLPVENADASIDFQCLQRERERQECTLMGLAVHLPQSRMYYPEDSEIER